ncbi:cell division protein SepF [Nanoarchaeota archaeon]
MSFLDKIKEKLKSSSSSEEHEVPEEHEEGYVEVSSEPKVADVGKAKATLRSFVLQDFESVKPILDSIREGYTIALVNIKPLKDKDLVELKRAINKLKKTCEAIDGDIAGFSDDWIAITPSFAKIYREPKQAAQQHTEELLTEAY